MKSINAGQDITEYFQNERPGYAKSYMNKLNVDFVSDAGGTSEIRLLNTSEVSKRIQSTIA